MVLPFSSSALRVAVFSTALAGCGDFAAPPTSYTSNVVGNVVDPSSVVPGSSVSVDVHIRVGGPAFISNPAVGYIVCPEGYRATALGATTQGGFVGTRWQMMGCSQSLVNTTLGSYGSQIHCPSDPLRAVVYYTIGGAQQSRAEVVDLSLYGEAVCGRAP